jgi:UDP-2,4-diacetamido-2,4,6-trideoxy-beta-L-altropyranose hydrolase
MKIVFRVDSSLKIGVGHVYRCLAIAHALQDQDSCNSIDFICCNHKGNLIDLISSNGFNVFDLELPENCIVDDKLFYSHWLGVSQKLDSEECIHTLKQEEVDWLIVDHYGIDEDWEKELQKHCKKIMVIDDLSDRAHQCDILLDQTFGRQKEEYKYLVKKSCRLLLGSQYATLRTDFFRWRKYSIEHRSNFKFNQLLISMGGIDIDNFTGKVVQILDKCNLPNDIVIAVVVGKNFPHLKSIADKLSNLKYKSEIMVGVDNIAEVMANSDIAIGAAGGSTWERCCLGLPTIQILTADNQKYIANNLHSIKAIELIDNISKIPLKIKKIVKSYKKISLISSSIVDGCGVQKVINCIRLNDKYINPFQLKPIELGDSDFIYSLQNKETRKYFINPKIPSHIEHAEWFDNIFSSHKSQLFIIQFEGYSSGVLRLDNIDSGFIEVSIIILKKYRGRGLAKKVLTILENLVLNRVLKATIHKDNNLSKKIFTLSGYSLNGKTGDFFEYIKAV